MSMTINDYVEGQRDKFRKLSAGYRAKVEREAKGFIFRNPGCADHSNYWRGLSARQIIQCNHNHNL